jgi:DNA-binding beta-propeller fold protein YncE
MQAAILLTFFGTFALFAPALQAQTSATFGEVIALGGIPSDIVLDESRQRLYLVNTAANRIDIWDYSGKSVIGSITVGNRPLGAAMSVDDAFLYVANHDDSTLSVITLSSAMGSQGAVSSTISLSAPPQGVEVELSGRVVICTDGTGTNNANNTLLVYDATQPSTSQVQAVTIPPPPATPPSLAPVIATATTVNGRLRRTPDGNYIIGVVNMGSGSTATTVAYVYETASTTVLSSRTVTGQSATMSVAPDSQSFMAGYTHYDLSTLNVLGQQSTANAPFAIATAFTVNNNLGGSVYAPDGTTLYSAFNNAAATTPPPTAQASTLMISDPKSLAIKLGINLPESVVGKIVITSDGVDAWAISLSGMTHLPLSTLYTYPILMPESNIVFLSQNDCNQGVIQQQLKINNLGGGKLTFAVPSTITGATAALEVSANSGVAPSIVTFTYDSGRSQVTRVPGTNLYSGGTGGTTNLGTVITLQLVSPNAINVPPMIRVYMNYRDSTMRGQVYPIPTVPNTSVTTNQGLQDIVFDPQRNLVYITNAGYNRIEVFDTVQQALQTPIPVGQLPHEMAMGLDGNTLYVAETGGETIDIVDLTQMAVTGRITLPPFPRAATAAVVNVSAMAAGLTALQFVANNGYLWEVINGQATPRAGTFVTGLNATTGAQTPLSTTGVLSALGSADGSSAIVLSGNAATLNSLLYNGVTDAYTSSRTLFTGTVNGYDGPIGVSPNGSYLLANGMVLNSALTQIGGATNPGGTPVTPPGQPANSAGSSPLRNVAAVAPVDQNVFLRMTTPVRTTITTTTTDDAHTTLQLVDTRTGVASTVAEMPDNPAYSVFGATRTPMPARQMVVDGNGTAYAITMSGLSVVPTAATGGSSVPTLATTKSVINANNGSAVFSPGSFVTITGTNLASTATATTLPPPTVLGGSCVLVDGVAIPLLSTSPTQIQAQIPASIRSGSNVFQVRSLDKAQRSTPIVVSVQTAGQ